MSNPIRTFIAVKILAPHALSGVMGSLDEMRGPLKTVDRDHFHVTLKFLGDIDPARSADVGSAMQAVAAGRSAFEVRIVGLGAFPSPQRPSVVWAGLEPAEPLVQMAAKLDAALDPLGFPREARAFHPHLTLARVRSRPPADLRTLLEENAAREFGRSFIDAVELFQSELGRGGPRYTPLSRGILKAR